MTLDTRLLELLVCPICKGPLEMLRDAKLQGVELVCHADRLAFPIRDGIPIMLEQEARALDPHADATPSAAD
ncbi:MAG TPA: Trm112 family protein [Burkholderiaceae bacterium]|nr:Trm112 family protein [Burkholderiaceae bacterium]